MRHEQLAVEDAMDRARVYFHPSFRERPRLAWLPGSLGEVSTLLEVDEVPGRDPLLRVHAPSLVERVERSRLRALALRSSAVVWRPRATCRHEVARRSPCPRWEVTTPAGRSMGGCAC